MNGATRVAASVLCSVAITIGTALPLMGADESGGFDLQARVTEFVGLVPGGAAALTVRDGVTTTAAAGIVDDRAAPVVAGSPFLIGFLGLPINTVIVLQFVDEGLLGLDELVSTYVPGAPVAADATVRNLLDLRAGVPDNYGQLIDLSLADPSHTWTLAQIAALFDPAETGPAGVFSPSIGHEIVTMQLIEAVAGADYPTVLARRITEPLGMDQTLVVGGDTPLPPGMAHGWELGLGFTGDPGAEMEAMRTFDGRTSSVVDLASFLTALQEGQLLSQEMMALMFDEDTRLFGMGFDTHDGVFGDLGDLGTHYFPVYGGLATGYTGTLAVDPVSGDLVIVLTNNVDLVANDLVRDIVAAWATEES